MRKAIQRWGDFLKLVFTYPAVVLPFLLSALFNSLALYLVYLAPQRPVSFVLAPPVIAFFGEKFLHYPLNLVLLPRLFYYAQVFISATFSLIFSAIAVKMTADFLQKNNSPFSLCLIKAVKKYFPLLGAWLMPFIISTFLFKFLAQYFPRSGGAVYDLALSGAFLLTIMAQLAFIYLIPFIIIEDKGLFPALSGNFRIMRRLFPLTFLVVIVPSLFYLPVVVLKTRAVMLMARFFPEIILLIMTAGIFIMFLIDMTVVVTTTIVFTKDRKS